MGFRRSRGWLWMAAGMVVVVVVALAARPEASPSPPPSVVFVDGSSLRSMILGTAERTTCLAANASCPSGSSRVGSSDFCCKDSGSYNRIDNEQCVSEVMEGLGIAMIALFLLAACLCCPCFAAYYILVFLAALLFPLDLLLVPLVLLLCCPCTLATAVFFAGVLLVIFHRVDPEARFNC